MPKAHSNLPGDKRMRICISYCRYSDRLHEVVLLKQKQAYHIKVSVGISDI